MTGAQPDPINRPNSALDGPPAIAQLHFVNARLEENPHPRQHYGRQFSITPRGQTPESQRTPLITWPEPDPIEELKEAKAWAANEAKRLEQFYAGRLLLRKEEPERYGIFGEDTMYWDSQTSHWKNEYEKLAKEYDRRKRLEAEGRVVDGYAQSLLLSPVQSPSPPPSNGILRATAVGFKKHKPAATRPSQQPVTRCPSQIRKKRSPQVSQLIPKDSLHIITNASKKWLHTEAAKELGMEEQREMNASMPKHRLDLATKSAPRPRNNTSRVSKTTTKKAGRQKKMSSMDDQAPRVLPWTLRSRNAISYRETGTRVASRKKRNPGRGKVCEGKYRLSRE